MSEMTQERQATNRAEHIMGSLLWYARLVMLVPVVFSVVVAVGVIVVTTINAVSLIGLVITYANPNLTVEVRDQINLQVILGTIGVVDTYLLSAILLIFGFGLYELFVGRIHIIQNSAFAARLLQIESIDDLKQRLARVDCEVFSDCAGIVLRKPVGSSGAGAWHLGDWRRTLSQ